MGGGACGAISHAVGPVAHVANGYIDAIVLPHVMRFNAAHTRSHDPRLRAALNAADSQTAAEAVSALFARMPIATRLRDIGLERKALPCLARKAGEDWSLQRNPRPVSPGDIETILESAW